MASSRTHGSSRFSSARTSIPTGPQRAQADPGRRSVGSSTSGCSPRLNIRVARQLPTGTVTFVFTDVEGSTRLLQELGASAYADALAQHRRTLRAAFVRHDGVEVDTQGDSFFIAFATAPAAIAASAETQQVLTEIGRASC